MFISPARNNTYVPELHQADLAQLRDTVVGRLAGQEELAEGHLFTAEDGPHAADVWFLLPLLLLLYLMYWGQRM